MRTLEVLAGARRLKFEVSAPVQHIENVMIRTGAIYEREMLDEISKSLQRPGLILDIGANIGTHSLYFAGVMERNVVAFEPNPEAVEKLRRNLQLNGLEERVRIESVALGRAPGRGHVALPEANNLGSAKIVASGGGEVSVVPLDSVGISEPVALIKIDVEGMEMDVIEGGLGLLARDRPDLCIECDDVDGLRTLFELLAPLGYRPLRRFNVTPTFLWSAGPKPETSSDTLDLEIQSIGIGLADVERRVSDLTRELRQLNRTVADFHLLATGTGARSYLATELAGEIERALIAPRRLPRLPFRLLSHLMRARRRRKSGAIVAPRAQSPLDGPLDERVSVIMTTFNSAEFMSSAIEGILSQSYQNYELIIVDDSSSDSSFDIASRFAASDVRVKAIRLRQNVGTYVAKNIGLRLAKGAMFATHDSDDRAHPDWLAILVGLLAAQEDAVAATCTYVRVDAEGRLRLNRGLKERPGIMCALYRFDPVVKKIGYFDSVRTNADAEYRKRIEVVFGKLRIAHVQLPLYNAIVRDGQLTQMFGIKLDVDHILGETLLLHPNRYKYNRAMEVWHRLIAEGKEAAFMPFPAKERRFTAPAAMVSSVGCDFESLIAEKVGWVD